MRMSNVIMLAVALICATAAALLTRAWLVRLSSQGSAPVQAAAPVPSRSVVVAARDLKYGDKLTAEAVKFVPWLGALLRSAAWQKDETDLVIIVTPRFIQPRAPGHKIATPLDRTLPSNDPEFFLG